MRVLVTGGSGILGQFVLWELVARGHEPVALVLSAAAAKAASEAGAEPIAGDLDEPIRLAETFSAAKADALVDLASLGLGRTSTIVAAAETARFQRALFVVPTTAIFSSLPARSNAVRTAAEETIRSSNLAWTIVRPTMIYGAPGDRNIERLLRVLRWCPIIPLPGGGRRLVQPVHGADLAWFVVTALEAKTFGLEFDIGGPEPLSLLTVVQQAATAVHRRPVLLDLPLQPVVAALRTYGRTTTSSRLTVEQILRLDEYKAIDISPARALGYEPRSFERGIGDVAREAFVGAATVGASLRFFAHLRPEQIAHRIRLRALRRLDRLRPPRRPAAPCLYPRWPRGFRSLEAEQDHGDASAIAQGRFTFLSEERYLGDPADWDQADAARLWRFNLHYFEWAWALAQSGDHETFARLWRSWQRSTRVGHPDAWAPYVASLRAWVLCDVFDSVIRGTVLEADVASALVQHLNFLERRLELDVGGNHLIKNLKALIGLGAFLDRPAAVARAQSLLEKQIPIQVLGDGGHYERSPSYHCQVLGDLTDIAELLDAVGASPVPGLKQSIEQMRRWLGAMLGPEGEVPMFNDSWPVGPERIARLRPVPNDSRLVALEATGYVVARPDGRAQLVADVGDPGPRDLPAHAHADCLSFELWVDGEKVITDTGTSTYEAGPRRAFERSTAAHNTVELDRTDQTEVWAVFRAGRRSRASLGSAQDADGTISITAQHDGYEHLPGSPVHSRTWSLTAGRLEVNDSLRGQGIHTVSSSLYASQGRDSLTAITSNQPPKKSLAFIGREFGQLAAADRYRVDTGPVRLPVELTWVLTW